jgi:hypothetical protein
LVLHHCKKESEALPLHAHLTLLLLLPLL